jgi:hypothetical protein
LADNESAHKNVARTIEDNFDMIPGNIRNEILRKLKSTEEKN